MDPEAGEVDVAVVEVAVVVVVGVIETSASSAGSLDIGHPIARMGDNSRLSRGSARPFTRSARVLK